MKKQIAVLMAAATAATTVAPVVANADSTTTDAKILDWVSKAKAALDDKYDTKVSGIVYDNAGTLTDLAVGDDKYLQSKNIVLINTDVEGITGVEGVQAASTVGGYVISASKMAFTLPKGYTAGNTFIVKTAEGAQALLEKIAVAGGGAKLAIINKGADGAKATKDSNKALYESFEALKTALANGYTADDVKKDAPNAGSLVELLDVSKIGTDNQKYATAEGLVGLIKGITFKDINGDVVGTAKASTKFAEGEAKDNITYSVTIEFKNGATQTVKLGDAKLDAAKLQDKNSQPVLVTKTDYADFVSKMGVADDMDDAKSYDIPTQEKFTEEILNAATVVDKDASTLYTADYGFTEAGKDFVDAFRAFNKLDTDKDKRSFNYNGKAYTLAGYTKTDGSEVIPANSAKITKVGDDYILVIDAKVKNSNDTQRTDTLEFRIKGKVQADLNTLKDYLFTPGKEVVVGRFNRLVGSDRYQTAIEVSKKRFEKDGSADSVVIVGGNALLDGLSAAPLASAQNASVLLASPRTGLSQATLDEISRATDKKLVKKTVYVIGGYDSVPASVDKVLADKFGAVVIRIAGADRYETSKKIAERLVYDDKVNNAAGTVSDAKIFYVGGNGAADAMSVAPVAATKDANGKVAPVLVVKKGDIDQQTRNFLISKLGADRANNFIIGGENSVSSDVYRLVTKLGTSVKLERISGVDRYATNVTTLKRFYSVDGPIATKGVIVASGANNALVDAQTAGEFAASKGFPILLAGSKLTDGQTDLINVNKHDTVFYKDLTASKVPQYTLVNGFKANVYQVGGAVSSDAMKVIVDKFGLTETSASPVEADQAKNK